MAVKTYSIGIGNEQVPAWVYYLADKVEKAGYKSVRSFADSHGLTQTTTNWILNGKLKVPTVYSEPFMGILRGLRLTVAKFEEEAGTPVYGAEVFRLLGGKSVNSNIQLPMVGLGSGDSLEDFDVPKSWVPANVNAKHLTAYHLDAKGVYGEGVRLPEGTVVLCEVGKMPEVGGLMVAEFEGKLLALAVYSKGQESVVFRNHDASTLLTSDGKQATIIGRVVATYSKTV